MEYFRKGNTKNAKENKLYSKGTVKLDVWILHGRKLLSLKYSMKGSFLLP